MLTSNLETESRLEIYETELPFVPPIQKMADTPNTAHDPSLCQPITCVLTETYRE